MDKARMTTTAGGPVGDNQNSVSVGPRGPRPLQDYQLVEKLSYQNRERIPERVVHAKGSGADEDATSHGSSLHWRSHDEMKFAGVKAVRDPAVGLVRHGWHRGRGAGISVSRERLRRSAAQPVRPSGGCDRH
jgi:hypothetical protein